MNINPKNWFWTQYLVIGVFIIVYIIISLHPWYYSISATIEEQGEEQLSFRQAMLQSAGTAPEVEGEEGMEGEFEARYKDGGKFDALSGLIVISYLLSISYVLGLFLTSTGNALKANLPLVFLMIIKTLWIIQASTLYKVSVKNVLVWWGCLVLYLIAFVIHDKQIITEVNTEQLA